MAQEKESLIQTLEQRRASKAWEFVNEVKDDIKSRYRSLALKAPVLILTNGLGQTLAFLKSKKENEHQLFYTHIQTWLIEETKIYESSGDLLKKIMEGDSTKYRQATNEALAFISWIKRFAEAVLPAKEGN